MALVGEGGGGGDWLTAAPVAVPVSNVAVMEAQDPGNYQQMAVVPEWQKKGFASEEEFLAVQQRAMMQNGAAPLPNWQSVSPQENLATGIGFGPNMGSELNVATMRPNSAVDQVANNVTYNTQAQSAPASGGNPLDAIGGWLGGVLNQIKNDALPPGMYPKGEGPTSIEQIRGTGGGVTGNVQSVDPFAGIEAARATGRPITTPRAYAIATTELPPKPTPPAMDPRNTGGTWTTSPNNPNSYYITGDVYTGERRGNPEAFATGFTNTNNLTEDAVTGYLSLENNRPRGMAQMVTPMVTSTGEMGRQPMPRPATPPRGPQPNDDPVSPSVPSPRPLPPGSVATPILDGAGNQVATKVTLPDGRTVWNIPNKNWDGSFGFPWTPPANFDLPAWLRDKTEGRPAPVQQDALRNRAQALPQQNMGQQIQQQVQQQMQQPVPAAPALPVAQGVPNAQALRESILQNVPGR